MALSEIKPKYPINIFFDLFAFILVEVFKKPLVSKIIFLLVIKDKFVWIDLVAAIIKSVNLMIFFSVIFLINCFTIYNTPEFILPVQPSL